MNALFFNKIHFLPLPKACNPSFVGVTQCGVKQFMVGCWMNLKVKSCHYLLLTVWLCSK